MSIKEALEHTWILKHTNNSLIEKRRGSKDKSVSSFEIYSSTQEK